MTYGGRSPAAGLFFRTNERLAAVKLPAALYGARTDVVTPTKEAGKKIELPAWREYMSGDYDWTVGDDSEGQETDGNEGGNDDLATQCVYPNPATPAA